MNFEEWLKEFCNFYISNWIFFSNCKQKHRRKHYLCNKEQVTKMATLTLQRAKLHLLDNKPLREDGVNCGKDILEIIEIHGKMYSLESVRINLLKMCV